MLATDNLKLGVFITELDMWASSYQPVPVANTKIKRGKGRAGASPAHTRRTSVYILMNPRSRHPDLFQSSGNLRPKPY